MGVVLVARAPLPPRTREGWGNRLRRGDLKRMGQGPSMLGKLILLRKPSPPGRNIMLGRAGLHGAFRSLDTVFTIRAVFFAGDQKGEVAEVRVVIGCESHWCGFGQDFAAIINVDGVGQHPPGAWRDELVQVEHWTTFFPDEGMQIVMAIVRGADNLPAIVQPVRPAATIPVHSSQVFDLSVFPYNRMVRIHCGFRSRKIC